jgi:hypothetical protein
MSGVIARPRLLSVTESHCALAPTEQAVRCNHVETNVFASDRSKSKAVGWLAGELGRSTVTHEISEGELISKSAEEGG